VGSIGRRKLRTLLTSLGVAIGIAAIVALLSITQGLQASVQEQLRDGLGTDTLTVTAKSGGRPLLTSDISTIEALDGVTCAAPLIQRAGYLSHENDTMEVSIVGMDMDRYRTIYSSVFVAQQGTIPANPGSDVVIVGAKVLDPVSNGTSFLQIGDRVTLTISAAGSRLSGNTYNATVRGSLGTIGPLSLGGLSDDAIYIPIAQAEALFGTDRSSAIIVKLQDGEQSTMNEVGAAIREAFDDQVDISSPKVIESVVSRVFLTLDLFLLGVGGITLLIAGIGIMNTMMVSLMERTREIGTLKSLGLKDRTVLSIFIYEAAFIGLLGGYLGSILGFLTAKVIAALLNSSIALEWSGFTAYAGILISIPPLSIMTVLGAIVFGLLVSVSFSLYPAWRASKLNPVDALRHE
jgi:putative ABC transport system permease protein